MTFAANEDSVAVKVITGMPFELESAVLQFALETVDHVWNPRCPALHETDAKCREPVKHSIDHHSGQSDRQRERHAEGAGRRKNGVRFESKIDITAAVHGHNTTKFFGFLIDRPVLRVANMAGEPVRGNHRPEKTQLFDRAA